MSTGTNGHRPKVGHKMRGRQREWTRYDEKLKRWLNGNFPDGRTGQRKALADMMGMPGSTISRMLNGRRRIAAAELPAMEKFFGTSAPKWKPQDMKDC